jgi:hypothetical protein
MANLSDQMGELNSRMQMISAAAPNILSFEDLAQLSEEERWGYYDTLKTYESSLEEIKESLEEVDRQMADSVLKAF